MSKKEVSSKGKKGKGTAAKVVKPGKAAKNVREIKAAAKRKRANSGGFSNGDQDD